MKLPTPTVGSHRHVLKALRPIKTGEIDGAPVVYIPLPNAGEVIMSSETWNDWMRAGYSPNLFLKANGGGRSYPASKAYAPKPGLPRVTRDAARQVVALRMVREERAGGRRAIEKGWVATTVNGDPNDLRDCNVVMRPAPGRRNSYLAVWDARVRLRHADLGQDPNRVFAERRRRARMLCRRNISPDRHGPLSQWDAASLSPRTAIHQGPTKSGR
jgi:hypothetical protein